MDISTAKDVTDIGIAGGLVIVQASLLEYPVPPYPVLRTHRPAGGSTAQPRPVTSIGNIGGAGGAGGEGGGIGGDGGGDGRFRNSLSPAPPMRKRLGVCS